MDISFDRRHFLATTTAVAVAPLLDTCSTTPPLTDAQLLELSAADTVNAIRNGRVSAFALMKLQMGRAEQLADLHALITLNKEGAFEAARRVDAAGGRPCRRWPGWPSSSRATPTPAHCTARP